MLDRACRIPALDRSCLLLLLGFTALLPPGCSLHEERWTAYRTPPTRAVPAAQEIAARDASCLSCHKNSRDPHPFPRVACVDCHGGTEGALEIEKAHPRPRFPDRWQSSANPERSYSLLSEESREWVRFINPGDLRVANETCGGCHAREVLNVSKSLMTTSAHFWGVAGYANGIVSNKRSVFGESYSPEGIPQRVNNLLETSTGWRLATADEIERKSYSPFIVPLPHWEVMQPGNVYRVFERGSRLGTVALGFNGAATPVVGLSDKLEDPGRPNNRLSDRGLGTLNRVDLPLLNVQKTRLNDPHLSFLGTNEQPGDYRSSRCTACHIVYANDRDPVHSGPFAGHGNGGLGNISFPDRPADPTLKSDEPGHPLTHQFFRGAPSSQCMVCHMHQPNAFVNSFYGFQMWTYETDGEAMWPKEEQYPSNAEWFAHIDRNPEEAAIRGNWGDVEFLKNVAALNPGLKHTQFADYHGHGWIFRAVLKMDRKGNLLDRDGDKVDYDDPGKFEGLIPELGQVNAGAKTPDELGFSPKDGRAVHLKDIHAEKGMHCVDCHFEPDVHGDGQLYAEYQAAIQIQCQDCHGDLEEFAPLRPSGPSAQEPNSATEGRESFSDLRTPFGKKRFEWVGDRLLQRSMVYPDLEWDVSQVRSSVDPSSTDFNQRAHYAKTQRSRDGGWAHDPRRMDCAACHTSWITSCFGCHLPQKANFRTPMHHFEAKNLRNFASYNPQVARDDAFMLGISGNVKGNRIATVRSSSAILISSEDAQRRIIYKQLPTTAANGMSSQCFNTHFAHTVRKTETRVCTDCHLSERNDNNAWLAQTYLLGTSFVNFMGMHCYVGTGEDGFEAVKVTEWDEPQAVIGSDLHRLAFPDRFQAHLERDRRLGNSVHHGGTDVRGIELRGEYAFTACGRGGFRVYDVANVANKDFSEKIVTSPVSPLGQDTHVPTRFATCVALPTNNYISMGRTYRPENHEQKYEYGGRVQNLHESYRYAHVSDREEGLILVDVDCLSDGDPENNFLERTLTFNPEGALGGAEFLTVAGTTVYVCSSRGVVAVDVSDPLDPKILATVGDPAVRKPTSIVVQFRYAFVTDAEGLKVLDVTLPDQIVAVGAARVEIEDARNVYVARTYAYVAAGKQGMVVVDVENPEQPRAVLTFNAEGRIRDLHQIKIAAAYDSIYAYLADGEAGLHVLSLVTPEDGGRSAYGFSPEPRPRWIASYQTGRSALAIGRPLDRDRAVDESGNQMAVFGRIGGRPFKLEEMRRLFLRGGKVFQLSDVPVKSR